MGAIDVGKPGAKVIVQVLDSRGVSPIPDILVTLLADPAGIHSNHRDSWLHHRAYRQREVTSQLGNVQFSGVPSGKIKVRVKTTTGVAEKTAVVGANEEVRITLEVL